VLPCEFDCRELSREVDLDHLKIVGLANNVVWHARWLANARPGLDNNIIRNAFEAELQPPLEHINEVTGHVVPMPAGLRFKWLDGADVFATGTNPLPPVNPSPAQQRRLQSALQVVPEPTATELRIGEDEWSRPVVGLPHTDEEGWRAQAKNAFGTASGAFVEAEIHRLLNALRTRHSTLPLEVEVNAAIAVIEAMQPRNEIEAMLASQMALAHVATMEMIARLNRLQPHGAPEQVNAVGGTAAKLMRSFSGHVDTLSRLRRPPVQVVRVERVNIEAGGQAIVGPVNHPEDSAKDEDQHY
jgi:hypothetical protein